jgi:hypothetical protein
MRFLKTILSVAAGLLGGCLCYFAFAIFVDAATVKSPGTRGTSFPFWGGVACGILMAFVIPTGLRKLFLEREIKETAKIGRKRKCAYLVVKPKYHN